MLCLRQKNLTPFWQLSSLAAVIVMAVRLTQVTLENGDKNSKQQASKVFVR